MQQLEYTDDDGKTLRGWPVVVIANRATVSTKVGSLTEFLDGDGRSIHATPLIVMQDYSGTLAGSGLPGGSSAVWEAITSLQTQLAQVASGLVGVNHKPVVLASSASVFDVSPSVTVNLLSSATDVDGNTLSIVGVSFQGAQRSVGTSFSTTYGTVLVQAGGICTYTPNTTAWALHAGQNVVETIGFVVSDGQGATVSSTVAITVVGQNNAPVAVADIGRAPYNRVAVGNVLSNDYDPDRGTITVTQYTVLGVTGTFTAGSVADIATVGSLLLNANGSWTFTPVTGFSGAVPAVTYTVSNGSLTATGVLNVAISPAASDVMANPVTGAMTGTHATYNVHSDSDMNAVPWGALVAGDVVNIYYSSTPYRAKFALRGQGTIGAPIVINGVTDSSGNRPQFDWSSGAFTAAGCNPSGGYNNGPSDVFGSTYQYGEGLGGLVIKRGVADPFGVYVPSWLQIKNIDFRGSHGTYTALDGTTQPFQGTNSFGPGIFVLSSTDCLFENCLVTDCGDGLFVQANNATLTNTSVRITVRNCRLWGNGINGSYYEHNIYMQAAGCVVEGCFLGQLRAGALGSSYKSRSSGEVFRYNWVEANARAMDFVHSEDNAQGIAVQPDYGITWCYGNTIRSDKLLTTNPPSGNPIHYGGDNLGEQDSSSTVLVPTAPYRSQLYFWNNTYYLHLDSTDSYRTTLFQLSLVGTRCDAWNNIIYATGSSNFSWLALAGILNLRGTNLVYGTVANASDQANSANYTFNKIGTVIAGDPLMVDPANNDYFLQYSSAAIDAGSAAPAGLPMANIDSNYPVEYQPRMRSNGYVARVIGGTGIDCGSTEYGVGYTPPPPPSPSNLVAPSISGSRVVGGLLNAIMGTWIGRPSFTVSFMDDANNVLGVGTSFSSTPAMVHTNVHLTVVGTNSAGTATAQSASVFILSTNAPVNTTPPSITGTIEEGLTVTLNAGSWTNSPDSYTYDILIDSVVQSGSSVTSSATSVTTVVPAGTGYHQLTLRVTAHRSAYPLDSNDASSVAAQVIPAPADPDSSGTFNFSGPNGTTLAVLNGDWQGSSSSSTIHYECDSGALQCTAGTGGNGELCYYTKGQGANQALEAKILAGWTGSLTLFLQQTGTLQGYNVLITPTSWQAHRGGIWQNQGALSLNTAADLVVKLTLVGGVFTVFVNGTQIFQMTDSTPITGGGLAFILGPGAGNESQMRMDYLKTNP